jgi:hypothetical protein
VRAYTAVSAYPFIVFEWVMGCVLCSSACVDLIVVAQWQYFFLLRQPFKLDENFSLVARVR